MADPSDDAEYGMVRSFGIDSGELDGLRPAEIFVLGYELAQVDHEIESGSPIDRMIHAENADRIRRYLEKLGRTGVISWAANDVSEGWCRLVVRGEEKVRPA